ncbi:MAG: hypothetical protein KGH64_04480 [Candidatus Micrarchaeota archaeon]|nr:hypothetical protein [Candidatus Micrarchaeota archaeon]
MATRAPYARKRIIGTIPRRYPRLVILSPLFGGSIPTTTLSVGCPGSI